MSRNNRELAKLRDEHPWLKRVNVGLYLDSEYYEKSLPRFSFDGKSDEEYLDTWLRENYPNVGRTLEIACGTGRMTKILHKYAREIVGIDKSPQMLQAARKRFEYVPNVRLVLSDACSFLNKAIETSEMHSFDSIMSFWGINYILHHDFIRIEPNGELFQALLPEEIKIAEESATARFRRLLECSRKGTRYLFFHVRSDTEEQIINRKPWGELNPLFAPPKRTPSQNIIEKVLAEMHKEDMLEYTLEYVDGTVSFPNLEKALETFFNFHSKGYFNNRPELVNVFEEMRTDLLQRRLDNGQIELGAGFILINISRE
jgi:SAM-dependent methyltransferase